MSALFTTDRLIIRPLQLADVEAFHKMQANPNVMQFTGDPPKTKHENLADLKALIDCYEKPDNDFWVWAVERKADGAFLGTCALVKPPEATCKAFDVNHEIGYRLLEEYWSCGYGKEVTQGLLHYAFTTLNKTAIFADVDELNTASVKILDALMSYVKTAYNPTHKCNDRYYKLTKAAYLRQNNSID